MAAPIKTGFPDGHVMSNGYVLRFRAVDPTTGADVAGVSISGASVFADTGGELDLQQIGPALYVPGPPGTVPVGG